MRMFDLLPNLNADINGLSKVQVTTEAEAPLQSFKQRFEDSLQALEAPAAGPTKIGADGSAVSVEIDGTVLATQVSVEQLNEFGVDDTAAEHSLLNYGEGLALGFEDLAIQSSEAEVELDVVSDEALALVQPHLVGVPSSMEADASIQILSTDKLAKSPIDTRFALSESAQHYQRMATQHNKPSVQFASQQVVSASDGLEPPAELTLVKPGLVDATTLATEQKAVLSPPGILAKDKPANLTLNIDSTLPLADNLEPELPRVGFESTRASHLASPLPSDNAARFSVNIQFGRPEWQAGVAAKVAQMAAQNLNFAEIQLDPPELGPLQVRVHVNQEQATVAFSVASSQVRDALEQHHNRLRDLLSAEGIDLVDVDVSDQGQQSTHDELDSEVAATNADVLDTDESEASAEDAEAATMTATIEVGVDDFA